MRNRFEESPESGSKINLIFKPDGWWQDNKITGMPARLFF